MATDRRSSWAPSEVFKEEPAAERGFDEQQLQNTIDDFARKYGASDTLLELAKAINRVSPHAARVMASRLKNG